MFVNNKPSDFGITKLYKYRSLTDDNRRFTFRTIQHRELMFSSPRSFNDPFEARPKTLLRGIKKDVRKYIIDLVSKQIPSVSADKRIEYTNRMWNQIRLDPQHFFTNSMLTILGECGILSLTTNPTHPLMWAHYASSHRGICLEFDATQHYFKYAQKVIYSHNYPSIDPLNDPDAFGVQNLALLTKAMDWRYEDEFRVLFFKLSEKQREQLLSSVIDSELRQIVQTLHYGHGVYSFPESALTGVIFGCEASIEDVKEISAVVRELYPIVQIRKVIRDESQFKLNLVDL